MEMNGDSMDRGKWDACAVNSSRRWGQHVLSNVDHSPLIDHGEKELISSLQNAKVPAL